MPDRAEPTRPPIAVGGLLGLGALVAVVLLAFGSGYGPHRDELYFVVAGDHLAWGYPDQGPLTPLIAHLTQLVSDSSLTVLRAPSALLSGLTVVLCGLLAWELGARPRAQLLAAGCMAVAADLLVTGHLLSTSTVDLTAWAAVTWLVARAIRTRQAAPWLAAGVVCGLALLNKPLIAFLLVALLIGLLLVGPRDVLRTPWPWVAALVALLLWAPWLIWQADHGWPQLDVSESIAEGGSASSESRWALVPFQLLLVSPLLAPVWIAGLVALLRRPALRPFRCFAVAWIALVAIFTVTGGKPYYLAGMFPVLLGAGAIEVDAWLDRGRVALRRGALAVAFVLSALIGATIALPVLPAEDTDVVLAMNEDAGETMGWPELVAQVEAARDAAGPGAIVLARNYGEAGAIERYGRGAYSGHNGFHEWGPPSPPTDDAAPVVAVGLPLGELERDFTGCELVDRVADPDEIDNEESGAPIHVCDAPRGSWAEVWPGLQRLG